MKSNIRCSLPAAVLVAVCFVAKLIGFGRIDSEQANAGAVNFDGVAVDNGWTARTSAAVPRTKVR
jgi:hypothetical protein